MTLIITIGLSIIGFVIFLQLQRNNKLLSEKFGIVLLFLWFVRFLLLYLKAETDLEKVSFLLVIDQNLFFLDGVFLFFYTKSLTSNCTFSLKKEWMHFTPFFAALTVSSSTLINLTNDEIYRVFQETSQQLENKHYKPSPYELTFILCIIIHNIFYTLLSLKKIKHHKSVILNNFSDIKGIEVNWIKKFIKIWIALLIFPLVTYFFNYLSPSLNIDVLGIFFIGSLVLSSIYLGIGFMNQKYVHIEIKQSKNIDAKIDKERHIDIEKLYSNLEIYMQEYKPYLKERLTLKELSEPLGINSNKLSFIINRKTKKNFFEYINAYRIESIKKELLNSNEQVIQIAYKNGFSSKSTFNDVFKKLTGYTPTQYRKLYKNC